MCKVICVTNRKLCGEGFFEQIERLARAKPDRIILREKDMSSEDYRELLGRVSSICSKYGTRLTAHTFVDAAVGLGIGSVHLPLDRLAEMTGEQKQHFTEIGCSCHSVSDAVRAEELGADYIIAGHIFETACKAGLPARGTELIKSITEAVELPVYAIGGINARNAWEVIRAGADGVCVMSGAMTAADPGSVVHGLRRAATATITPTQLCLYGIIGPVGTIGSDGSAGLAERAEAALRGGVTMLQLRDKGASHDRLVSEAKQLLPICRRYGVLLIVDDDWQAALEAGADGVHVGLSDTPVGEIRERAGRGFIIGATAKTLEQAAAAREAGADYLGSGALFATLTKPDAIRMDKALFKDIADHAGIPVAAIGGINERNIGTLHDIHASGFAVSGAVFGSEDIEGAARRLRKLAEQLIGQG